MPDQPVSLASCRVGGPGRLVRAVVSVVAAAFAVTLFPLQPVIGAIAGGFSVFAAVMAITGWCPADYIAARRTQAAAATDLGLPDARAHLDLASATHNRSSHVHE